MTNRPYPPVGEQDAWNHLYQQVLRGNPAAAAEVIKVFNEHPELKERSMALYLQSNVVMARHAASIDQRDRIVSSLSLALSAPWRAAKAVGRFFWPDKFASAPAPAAATRVRKPKPEPAQARVTSLQADPEFAADFGLPQQEESSRRKAA